MRSERLNRTLLAALVLLLGAGMASTSYAAALAEAADAAQNRDANTLRALVSKKANVNLAQPDGTTALHWAAHWNDSEAVTLLLRAGASAKAVNRYGATPLSEAVTAGSAAIIEALLNAGADAKSLTTEDGETVLMTAARAGNVEAVKVLLSHGTDVNAKESYKGQTALMWAAAERHPEVVKLLLDRGADWKARSIDRETRVPKLSAASSISPLARGGFTALLFSAREGDVETARVMLDAGVDVNYGDVDNASALVVALMNKQYSFAKYLLDRGADPNVVDAKGRGALYAAVDIRNEDWSPLPARKTEDALSSLDIIKAIIARGANLNAALTKNLGGRSGMDTGDIALDAGTTPLMRAARSGDAAVMRLLIEKGADPKLATKDGSTAFMFAAGVGYRDKNTTGTESQALEALKVAFEQGVDLNQVNTKGETALHGAASRGADTIVQFLVERGAKLDTKTRTGFTPLDVAMGKGSFGLPVPRDSTVAVLQKLGAPEGKDVK